LQGLDPNKTYKVDEINDFPGAFKAFRDSGKTFTGDYLMKVGLQVSAPWALNSSVLEISE